jgi:hypothetical protein
MLRIPPRVDNPRMQNTPDSDVFPWILSALVLVIMGAAVGLYSGGPEPPGRKTADPDEYRGAGEFAGSLPRVETTTPQTVSAQAPSRL